MTMLRAAVLTAALSLPLLAPPLGAQDSAVRLGAGVALPVGGVAELRGAGPAAALSLESRVAGRWSVRLGAEWAVLAAGPTTPEAGAGVRELRTVGISAAAVRRFGGGAVAPYLLLGAGGYRLQEVGGSRTPYGTTGALQAGIGVDVARFARLAPFAEARALVHATDYGSREWSPTVYLPVQVGVRVH
jgi:hypothetical protein